MSELALLSDQLEREHRKPLEYLQRTTGGSLEVLAAAHSGAQGLLALTDAQLVFVWKVAGLGGGTKTLVRDRSAIIAAQVDGNDLLLRDAQQLWRFKNVSPSERAAEIATRLQQAGARETIALQPSDGPARSALNILPAKTRGIVDQALRPGENVHVVFVGANGQAMIAADDRMLVAKSGFMAGATFGSKQLDFPYDQISGIELHVGAMTGYLQIQSSSYQGNLPGSYWSSDKKHDPWKLPNCIPVGRAAATKFQSGLALVRERIAKRYWTDGIGAPPPAAAQTAPTTKDSTVDLVGQLKELAELRDSGVLSDEEFLQAKHQLLG
jgi:Short C-terminal domain